MSASDLATREERPAYVSFERVPVEDKAASLREGRYVAKDVDYVLVTPAYSRDCYRSKVDSWFQNTERNVRDGRTPERWLEIWRDAYEKWRNGQSIPINGTPIKGWGVISPAQQEMLIRVNCLTVEDLAATNDEGLRRIGMGGLDMKNKAAAWLQSMKDHGPLTLEVARLQKENANLIAEIDTLKQQLSGLMAQVKSVTFAPAQGFERESGEEIGISDIMPDEVSAPRRGRPPKAKP